MELGIEPKGVDLVVERVKRTKQDMELVSKAIAHHKATGEKLSAPHPVKTLRKKAKKEVNSRL
jgi:hypothetical protein